MGLINDDKLFDLITEKQKMIQLEKLDSLIVEPFTKDFSYRFCWSSNALEGNTLSLEETVALLAYDEVSAGHTFTEYQEAKCLHHAICKLILPFNKRKIEEKWLKEANGIIRGIGIGNYRQEPVYIGNLTEAVYYPPHHEKIEGLMEEYLKEVNFSKAKVNEILNEVAKQHLTFEKIHPFKDGNGRVGRMILNQQLVNNNLLPISINPTGKYRQAFRIFDKNGDVSPLVHLIVKGELEAFERIEELQHRREGC